VEVYKDIKNYEGLYMVSNCGNVKSLKSGCVMKQRYDKYGYKRIGLRKDGKLSTFFIHRLVAEAFIDNPFGLPCINHIDEDKENNNFDNLEWCSQKYNVNYGNRNSKIARTKCKPILCVDTGKIFTSIKNASKAMQLNASCISSVCNGKARHHKGYKFEFVSFPCESEVI